MCARSTGIGLTPCEYGRWGLRLGCPRLRVGPSFQPEKQEGAWRGGAGPTRLPSASTSSSATRSEQFDMRTLAIYDLFRSNYCMFDLIRQVKIALCIEFHWNKLMNYKCLNMRLVLYCRTTGASTAPCTSRRMCCPYALRGERQGVCEREPPPSGPNS